MALQLEQNVPLAPLTTLQVGGAGAACATITTEAELNEAITLAQAEGWPITVIGGGSNVLVPDAGLAGLVILMRTRGIESTVEGERVLVTAAAGENFDALIAHTVAAGWWGLENLSHIPGSVGAVPVQNVGAYGVEAGELITTVRVFDTETMQFQMLTAAECRFGYRDSIFKQPVGQRYIVVAVTFALSVAPQPRLLYRDLATRAWTDVTPQLAEIRDAVIAIRAAKFPDWSRVGTAGSFFKNPIISRAEYEALVVRYPELPGWPTTDGEMKVSLGWILDKILHRKGTGTDRVGLYAEQALVLINKGGATSADIVTFANEIAAQVKTATGISIEWEVRRL